MKHTSTPDPNTQMYRITVKGRLVPEWLQAYTTLEAVFDGNVTQLSGPLQDQAALRGLLGWLWDLNLTVLALEQMPPHGEAEKEMRDE